MTELGLWDDTVLVFTTDHGEMLGTHGMWGKGVMYEPSVRVPCLIRLPGQRRGGRIPGPTSQIDLVPTLLDYLGVEAEMPGRSLRDRLEEKAAPREVVIEWNCHPDSPRESARTLLTPDGWKLTLSTEGRQVLCNLKDDPWETGNVFRGQPARAAALRRRLAHWQKSVKDPLAGL
jgi:arylsulfatase A-like enzyme